MVSRIRDVVVLPNEIVPRTVALLRETVRRDLPLYPVARPATHKVPLPRLQRACHEPLNRLDKLLDTQRRGVLRSPLLHEAHAALICLLTRRRRIEDAISCGCCRYCG